MLLRPFLAVVALWIALASRCDEPRPREPSRPPEAGDFVRLRGTLSEDVDCRLLRPDDGQTYSLSARLRGFANGSKVCVEGTVAEVTQCLQQPTIEVQSIRPWSSCP